MLVAAVAGPAAVLRADEPATQPAQKDDKPAAASKPVADKRARSDQPPQLRFLAWQEEDRTKARETSAAWKPNGEPAADEADLKILQQINFGGYMGGPANENWRFLCLWFSHPDLENSGSYLSVAFVDASGKQITGTGGVGWRVHPRGKDGMDDVGWGVVIRSPGREGDIPKTATVVLQYAFEPWETIGTVNAAFEGPVAVVDTMVEEATDATDGVYGDDKVRATLRISRVNDYDSRMQHEIVAVLFDGRELSPSGASSSSSREGMKATYTFNATLSDIKLFEFRKRPILEATYKNVSLQPATPEKKAATKPAAK